MRGARDLLNALQGGRLGVIVLGSSSCPMQGIAISEEPRMACHRRPPGSPLPLPKRVAALDLDFRGPRGGAMAWGSATAAAYSQYISMYANIFVVINIFAVAPAGAKLFGTAARGFNAPRVARRP